MTKKSFKKKLRKIFGLKLLTKFFDQITIGYAPNDKPNNFSPRILQNVRLTTSCVVLQNWRVIKSTIIFKDRFNSFNRLRFLLKYLRPSFPFAKKGEVHITIADEWCKNYCHWMFESLTRLLVLKEIEPQAKLLLPHDYLKIGFVTKSLEAFGIKSSDIIPIKSNSNFKSPKLLFVPCCNNEGEIFSTPGYYDFLRFAQIRKAILTHFDKELKTDFGEKIYISRNCQKSNNMRQLINESEIVKILEGYGFKTVYAENFSFLEQVSIAKNAKFIVAVHGAGIANAIFLKEGGKILELMNSEWQNDCFAQMAQRLGLRHIQQKCVPQTSGKKMTSNIFADISEFEKNLIKILH